MAQKGKWEEADNYAQSLIKSSNETFDQQDGMAAHWVGRVLFDAKSRLEPQTQLEFEKTEKILMNSRPKLLSTQEQPTMDNEMELMPNMGRAM